MPMKFFTIPIFHPEPATTELNRFLAQHRIETIERGLVTDGGNSAWAIAVGYQAGSNPATPPPAQPRGKVDYREVLNDADFAVYVELRELRKRLASEQGTPMYNVFKNEQMAQMVTGRVTTLAALRQIDGVGEARVEKYAGPFLQLLQRHYAADAQPASHSAGNPSASPTGEVTGGASSET